MASQNQKIDLKNLVLSCNGNKFLLFDDDLSYNFTISEGLNVCEEEINDVALKYEREAWNIIFDRFKFIKMWLINRGIKYKSIVECELLRIEGDNKNNLSSYYPSHDWHFSAVYRCKHNIIFNNEHDAVFFKLSWYNN